VEIVHNPEGDTWEDEFVVDITLGCLWSKHPPVIDEVDGIPRHLDVVRYTLTQPKESDDWRRSSIFQTLSKISGENCWVIVDNESYINVVTSSMVS